MVHVLNQYLELAVFTDQSEKRTEFNENLNLQIV